MADTNSEIFTSFQSNNDGRKCFDNWNMFLVGILTFKIVVCVCHIEMSIYRNKRERSTSKLCYIREKSREKNRCDITNNTLNRPAFTQNSAFVYDKHANILSPLFCVVSRGSPIFYLWIGRRCCCNFCCFPPEGTAAVTVVASFLFLGSNECASHFSLDNDIQLSMYLVVH